MKCWKCYNNSQFGEHVYISIRAGEDNYVKYHKFLCRSCLFLFGAYRSRKDVVEYIQSRERKVSGR